jgi:putative ABC transport system permease protein
VLALCYRDQEWSEGVIGDLREEYEAIAVRQGMRAARRWHWGQALRLTGRRLAGQTSPPRVRRGGTDLTEPREQGRRLSGLQRDVAYAVRSLARRPALTLVMIGALAVGLAANATIFTVLDAIVLRPFRFAGVDRYVAVASRAPTEFFGNSSVAAGDYLEWTEQATTVTDFAGYRWWEPNLTGHDEPEQLPGFHVSPSFFRALGVAAFRGRTFTDEDALPSAGRRVVMSHRLWVRRFASDPAIVGQTLRLDGEEYEVVGVAPEGFRIPMSADLWGALQLDAASRSERRNGSLSVIARLVDGATVQAAQAEMSTIVARQREQHPETNGQRSVTVKTFTEGMKDPGGEQIVGIWQVASLLLLFVACANVLNLLLARGVERQQEFAVRLALGASRGRIVRQVLLEGAILAGIAIACSIPLAWLGVRAQQLALPASIIRFVPGWEYLHLAPRTLLVTAVLAALATLLFSVAPALQASRGVVADALRQGGRTMTSGRRRSWGRAIVASAQIALTLALLTGAAVGIGAAYNVTRGALGFDPSNVLIARLLLPNKPYDDKTKRLQFIETVLDRMRAVPAVQLAGVTSAPPYGKMNTVRPFYPEGATLLPAEVKNVDLRRVTSDYLRSVRIPLVRGRELAESDVESTNQVAVVSQTLAQRYWPGVDPLQQRFRLAENGPWMTVVGVVGDVTHDWFLNQRNNPTVYRPATQDPPYNLTFVVRSAGDPMSLAGDLRRAIDAADPNQPIRELLSMQEMLDQSAAGLHYGAKMLSTIGGIALLLALMGIYSLMSYLASRRTQEIGVRMAFGATRRDVVGLTLRQAARITIAGLVVGIGLSIALSQAMQALMFGAVTANLMLPFGLAALLAAAALGASYLPARRAAALDPTVALRAE